MNATKSEFLLFLLLQLPLADGRRGDDAGEKGNEVEGGGEAWDCGRLDGGQIWQPAALVFKGQEKLFARLRSKTHNLPAAKVWQEQVRWNKLLNATA